MAASSLPAYKAGLKKAVVINNVQVGALKPKLIKDRRDWRGFGKTFITELRHHAVFSVSLGFVDGDDDPAGRLVTVTFVIPKRAPLLFNVRKLGWNKAQPNLTSILPADLLDAVRRDDVVGMSHEAFQTHYDYLLPWGLRVKNIVDAKLFLQCTAQPTDEGAARRTYELPKKPTKLTLPDALEYWAETAQSPFAACLERMVFLAESKTLEELGKLLVDPASFTKALLDPYALDLDQESGPHSWRLRLYTMQLLSEAKTRLAALPLPPPAVWKEDAGPSTQSSGDEEEASSLQPPLPETQKNDKQDLQEKINQGEISTITSF